MIAKITTKLEAKFPHRELAIHCVEVVRKTPDSAGTIRFCTHSEKIEISLRPKEKWEDLTEAWWEQWHAFTPNNPLLNIGLASFIDSEIKEFKLDGTMLKEIICRQKGTDRYFKIVPNIADNRFLDMQGIVRMCG